MQRRASPASFAGVQVPLFVHAAPAEGDGLAAAHPAHRFVLVGVGPARASFALTRALLGGRPPSVVCALGVAGAYPARIVATTLRVGDLVVVGDDVLADEGVETEDGFVSTAALGLVGEERVAMHAATSARLARALAAPIVAGATVSTCSGTDARARAVQARSAAQVETMEGAALGLVCARFAIPFVQVRSVSNLCGDRRRGEWDLARALASLHAAVPRVVAALTEER